MSTEPVRILMLEDSTLDAELIQRELRRAGIEFSATRVETEEHFRAALESTQPDIILADYSLPEFDGLTALTIARTVAPDIPFIFISGSIGEERATQALREGAADYIIKDRPSRIGAAVTRAIADRKERALHRTAQERLRQSEERFRSVAQTAYDGIVVADSNDRILFWNRGAEKIFGYEVDEITHQPVIMLIAERFRSEHRRRYDESLRMGDSGRTYVMRGLHKNGSEVPIELSLSSWRSDEQTCCTLIIRDITLRVQSERRFRLSSAVTQVLVEATYVAGALNDLLRTIGEELTCRAARSWLVEDDSNELHEGGAWHAESAASLEPATVWSEGLVASVRANGLAVLRNAAHEGQCAFAFPVIQDNRVTAVFEFLSDDPQAADPDLLRLLDEIGHRIGEFVERRRAQERLIESEARLADAQRLAQVGSWSLHVPRERLIFSEQAFSIFGIRPAQFAGTIKSYLRQVHPDDHPRVRALVTIPLAGEQIEDHHRIIRGDGSVRVIHARARVVEGTAEAPILIVGTAQDVTEEVERDETIRRLSRQNELILQSAAEGIFSFDIDGKKTIVNPAVTQLTGWSIDELMTSPRTMHELIHHSRPDGTPYPAEECPALQTMKDGVVRSGEEVFFKRSGQPIPVYFSASPIVEMGRIAGVVVTLQDMTERKRLERRLEQANRVASLGRVAATIAHEFNNVLMGIQPFAEAMRRRAAAPDDVRRAADQIVNSVARGKRVTQEILRFTQHSEPALQTLRLDEWVQQVLPELRGLAGKAVEVFIDAAEEPVTVRCDPAQMHQILTNLVINARDAMPAGGRITISIERARNSAKDEDIARLTVRDTGSGIAADTLPLVFEPFFTTKRSGTGLGLAVTQQVIVRHGGSIEVESASGKGTAFIITLPLTRAERVAAPVRQQRTVPVRRIVLIEDDIAIARGVSSLLETENVEVIAVHRGEDALDAVVTATPDAVVLDLTLPGMSGIEVFRRLTERWPDLPVVFSSGSDSDQELDAYRSERVAVIRKPYDLETLFKALERVMRRTADRP